MFRRPLVRWATLALILTLVSCGPLPDPSDPAGPVPASSSHSPAADAGGKQAGLMLDSARHFYSVEVLKAFIDTLAAPGGTFLHLHFSDHENYALESEILGQRAADAVVADDGTLTNPATGRPFLSFEQLAELKAHARSKGVELVPEIDSPSHMTGIFELLEISRGAEYVASLKSSSSDEEIDITNEQSVEFVKSLIGEVADAFGDSSRHFHIGGDEFGYSSESNHEFVAYANELADYLQGRGLTPRIWNDGIIKATLPQLNHEIQVTYWSYDGDSQDPAEAQRRREIRASLPELIEQGFEVLNYNSYFLYLIPNSDWGTSHDADVAARDAEARWDLGLWDGQNEENPADPEEVLGAAVAIWGEDADELSGATIERYSAGLVEAVARKTLAADASPEQTQSPERCSYADGQLVADGTTVDLQANGTGSLLLLQEEALSHRSDLELWVTGTSGDEVALSPNWQATNATQQRDGAAFRGYEYDGSTLWVEDELRVTPDATGECGK